MKLSINEINYKVVAKYANIVCPIDASKEFEVNNNKENS